MPLVDPHTQFCCLTHGCRFNNNDKCAVASGQMTQINKCGESAICSEYPSVEEGEDYDTTPYDN